MDPAPSTEEAVREALAVQQALVRALRRKFFPLPIYGSKPR
jgi:hypothetical protein